MASSGLEVIGLWSHAEPFEPRDINLHRAAEPTSGAPEPTPQGALGSDPFSWLQHGHALGHDGTEGLARDGVHRGRATSAFRNIAWGSIDDHGEARHLVPARQLSSVHPGAESSLHGDRTERLRASLGFFHVPSPLPDRSYGPEVDAARAWHLRGRSNRALGTADHPSRPCGSGHNAGMTASPIEPLGQDVFHIDTRMGGYEGITSGYLIRSSRPCLVETGTARSAGTVIAALAELGVGAEDLSTIVVTHIHLDHAGGVGDLAEAFPHAKVVVHERGARHLADPTKLVASAHRIFGADMDRLFGDLRPVPQERLIVLGETGVIDLGDGRELRAFHNPGHASHHVGLLDSLSGDLYTGDAAGVYVPETADVRPATPPPDFDLDLCLDSMARMRSTGAQRLLFSHFGPVTDVTDTLDRSAEELLFWVDEVRIAHQRTPDLDHAIAMVRKKDRERNPVFYKDEARVHKFDELSGVGANVQGIVRWLDQQEA